MARVTLNKDTYTQVNTDEAAFLIQNVSSDVVVVIISDTQPADDAAYDFVLNPTNGIGNFDVQGIVWAKCVTFDSVDVSVVEG